MKREWTDLEFTDWTLLPSEAALLANKTGPTVMRSYGQSLISTECSQIRH